MTTRKPNRRHERIWRRLATWYGARLGDQYGPTMPEDWCKLIDATDDARLEIGLLNARRASPLHPITLPLLESSIPKRSFGRVQGVGESLVAHATKKHPELCKHQLAQSWPFFANDTEVRGMTIPACGPCERESLRIMTNDLLTT